MNMHVPNVDLEHAASIYDKRFDFVRVFIWIALLMACVAFWAWPIYRGSVWLVSLVPA